MESERLPASVDVVGWLVSTSGIASAIFGQSRQKSSLDCRLHHFLM